METPPTNLYPPPTPASRAPIQLPIPSHQVIVTWVLIGSNVVVLILMELNGGSENTRTLITFGAKVNELIDQGQWWRLFTAMFIHIGYIHLLVNCYSLYNVGSLLERSVGSIRFAVIYFLAGLCGSFASYWFSPFSI